MAEDLISIKYDGGDATKHVMDMRLLGESLIGFDRIVSDGLIAITTGRVPLKGQRATLVMKAREPVEGSFTVPISLEDAVNALQLGMPLVSKHGRDLIWQWVKAVFSHFSGRKDIAEKCLDTITDITREHLNARDKADERAHDERLAHLAVLYETMQRLGSPASSAVAPVGKSVKTIEFASSGDGNVEINEEVAAAVREHGEVDWGDLEEMVLRAEGFTFHTGRLSVEHPYEPGFLLAEVKDPIFKDEGNPYTVAAQNKSTIRVLAKAGMKAGRLAQIAIMDFRGEV